MKNICLVCIMFFLSIPMYSESKEWKEIQSIEIPQGTTIYQKFDINSGNTKYYVEIVTEDFKRIQVPVSKSNAMEFISGYIRLELVKWYDWKNNSYRYTTRRMKSNSLNIDLSEISFSKF